ncbi:hypothetical protein Trydic_g3075 [Trypoxylus dichotomus]
MNRNLTTGGNSRTDMEETFANNLDKPTLRKLFHKIMEIYQSKFGEESELREPKTEEYMEETKRHKKRSVDSKPKKSQSTPTRNKYEALATDDSDVEDMQEGTDDEIPKNTKEEQSKKNEGKNKTARPQKQEEFKHKVAPIITKEKPKWTKTSNMTKRKIITATKCKLIQTGIQVELATKDDYRKLSKMLKEEGIQFYTFQLKSEKNLKVILRGITQDITEEEIKDDLQQQDYPVEKISRMKRRNGQPTPLVLIECPANPNTAAVNKKFIDAPPPKVNPWTKERETTDMKSEAEKRPAKEDPVNRSDESEEKLALILGRMVLNFNSTNATTEQRLAFLQQTEELTKLYKTNSPQNDMEEADIDAVSNSDHPTILAGDLNSEHPQWNSKTLNRKGNQL